MAKAFDDYSSFKIEKVEPRIAPKRRRFKLSLLFLLVFGWALMLQVMGKAGSLSTLLTVDIPMHLQRFSR
jgi:hypothetical protein